MARLKKPKSEADQTQSWKLSENRVDEVLLIAGLITGEAMRLAAGEAEEALHRRPGLTLTNRELITAVGHFRAAIEKIVKGGGA